MIRIALLLLAALGACRDDEIFVLPRELVVADGTRVNDRPQLDILVRMTEEANDFNPFDLMQLIVDGTDRADEAFTGSFWTVYTIDAPGNATFMVDLNRRLGDPVDSGMYVTVPYSGPTVTSISPDTAMIGTTVTITGTGFDQGVPSVRFGGFEGIVQSNTATQIVVTVPNEAVPGLVWVVIDSDTADGLIGFQPLDDMGAPVPFLTTRHIDAIYPARGPRESIIRVYGRNFDDEFDAYFNGKNPQRIFNVQTITVAPIGDVTTCFAVPGKNTDSGRVNFKLEESRSATNILPFTVEDE